LLALGRTRPLSLVVIGSDRQAVDLAFALQFALPGSRVTLLSGGAEPGSDCAAALRQRILRQLRLQGITVLQERCVGIESDQVLLGSGATLACDAPLVACGDEPPAWLQASGLALDDAGLVRVNAFQQSSSHGNVFAGGDIASRVDLAQPQQRRHGPREGLALDFNLRAVLADSALKPYRPASQTLDLISYGDRQAIAGWGEFCVQGRWVWYLRDALEQRELRQMSRR
jgi:NADH dehydrogenase FAD-containing subunit